MASLQKYEEKNIFRKENKTSPISKLVYDINNNKYLFDCIKYPKIFLSSLSELENLIGNNEIKISIVKQIRYLINEMKEGNKNKNMLNTILYGPPGTGKTTIAKIMAKIWYSLGCIEKEPFNIESFINQLTEQASYLLGYLIFFIYFFNSISNCVTKIIKKIKINKYFIFIIIFLCLITAYLLYFDYIKNLNVEENPEDVIKVVSREDFVDFYLGWSDKKTIKLLEKNKGKVLFIDEAYSLYSGTHDMYGSEVLTTINRYLSENPGKIYVIMAGYKNLIQNNLFSIQPGLPRRFMWHFECNGYDEKELYNILLHHISNEGWNIYDEDKDSIRKLLEDEYDAFKNYAGDIEKLIFYSKLDYTEHKGTNKTLEYYNIKYGVDCLKNNLQ